MQVLIVNRKGKIIRQKRFDSTEKELRRFFAGISKNQIRAVIESCGTWGTHL